MKTKEQFIKVALTDDHPMVLEGMQKVLEQSIGVAVTGVYRCAKELFEGLKKVLPDVLLLDVQLPDMNGLEVAKIIRQEHADMKILVLSGIESHYYIIDLIKNGCNGYLLKSTTDIRLLMEGVKGVYNGELFLDPSIKQVILQEMLRAKRRKNASPKLTEREKEVLQLIIEEYGNHEIANKLFISLRTVENHRYNLLQKLDVKNTVGLVKAAMQMGLDK
ncbi:MAG: response regulator transcription factor [Taibaiella sp.]|jgi:DNA-binding NarL/FixJ family response regulator